MTRVILIACILLSACATSHPPSASEQVLHYLRTNSDGTEGERVVVHVVSPTHIEVFKARERCTNAAYVTAQLDSAGQARHLVGGRLTRELTQEPFAWLDDEGGRLVARLGARDARPVFDVAVAERWVLFDFDFADVIAALPPEIANGEALGFDFPLLFDHGEGFVLENLGRVELVPDGQERHEGVAVHRYPATGGVFGAAEGTVWFRSSDAQLLEARLPRPNHSEYRDFHLTLEKEERGPAAWQAVLADHWRGCAAAD